MALSADTVISTVAEHAEVEGVKAHYQVAASTTIYDGGFVALNTAGNLVMLTIGAVAATLDPFERFVGIALGHVDNSAGAAGAKSAEVLVRGSFQHALSSAAQTDVGMPVFATADNTLSKVSAGSVFIGWVRSYVSSGIVIVSFGGTMNNSFPLIARVSASIETVAANKALLIHPTENHNGLILLHAFGIVTETFGGDSEDQGIITLEDTDGTDVTTLTPSNAGADTAGDIIQAAASSISATSTAIVVIPADKGLQAFVSQLTSGASEQGAMKVGVVAMPIA